MKKTELRRTYVDAGWAVQQVASWNLVSDVEGVRKYDANVVSPENKFFTAQIIVTDDGGANEEAIASGGLVENAETFDQAVRDYGRALEGAGIFAVTVAQVFSADEVALATVYTPAGAQTNYVVKRRSGTFTAVELV